MKLIRHGCYSRFFTVFAGAIFLNMSFVVLELSEIGIERSSPLFANILNSGFEEEKETETGEHDASKELFFNGDGNLKHHVISYLAATERSRILGNLSIRPGFKDRFFPPPKEMTSSFHA